MPHLPKFKVIEELNPKNGHFDNNVLKSLHINPLPWPGFGVSVLAPLLYSAVC